MADANEIDLAVGANLAALRARAGLSTEVLGDAAALENRVIETAEAGGHRLRASELFRLSQALGVPVGRFYDGLGPKGPLVIGSVAEGGHYGRHVELQRR